MQKEHFKANTQYNDYKGTVAADRADQDSFSDFLRAKGILKEGEIVKGISFFRTGNLFDVEAYIMEHGPNIPGGLYKINDNKVKFPLDYKEVEGVIDTEKLTFTVCGTVYKMIKPSEPFAIPVRFPT